MKAVPVKLRVSDNRRFLVRDDGRPFFWLGDTAWELFHRLDRAEADHYLHDRASKGFTVVQAVGLSELDGLTVPNANGHLPLVDRDPTRPVEAYWRHVDEIVAKANSLGLVVGFLPTWGSHWKNPLGQGGIFTPDNAEWFGRWLGRRYRDAALVWIMGGDRPVETAEHREIIRRMVTGLRESDGGAHLFTFHSQGAAGSAEFFHDDEWLDFNMRQNGHVVEYNPRYEQTCVDYQRTPIKPVLDGEPVYEDIPIDFNALKNGHATTADVRRPLYWNLFTGAFGHTYGHNSVWQMYDVAREPKCGAFLPWRDALQRPGATQMRHARQLLESRPFLTRIPDQSLLVLNSTVPGGGRYFFAATRDQSSTYAMIYVPTNRPFRIRTSVFPAASLRSWWFNPRDGSTRCIGTSPNSAESCFSVPNEDEDGDWVLVIDDANCRYPTPGSREFAPI